MPARLHLDGKVQVGEHAEVAVVERLDHAAHLVGEQVDLQAVVVLVRVGAV